MDRGDHEGDHPEVPAVVQQRQHPAVESGERSDQEDHVQKDNRERSGRADHQDLVAEPVRP